MLALAAAAVISVALMLPHLLPLHRASPALAASVWLLALALRAVSALALATLALVELADASIVEAGLAWCWHELLPDLPAMLGFAEHPVSHAVVAMPALALAASLAWLAAKGIRGALALRRLLRRALGGGPLGSTVVHDERVMLAVTGIGRGRVLVSDRALTTLDDEELAAGLMHEHAHLRRFHRPVLVVAALLGAVGRVLPGTGAAGRELRFQLERDADQYTVARLRDPLALASAICKTTGVPPSGALAALGGRGRVTLRLEELLDGDARRSSNVERSAWALMALLGCIAIALVASVPAWGLGDLGAADSAHHDCQHTR